MLLPWDSPANLEQARCDYRHFFLQFIRSLHALFPFACPDLPPQSGQQVHEGNNGTRLTPFHLLNLGATRSWRVKERGNRYHNLTLSVYNVYNRDNAYSVDIRPDYREVIDPVTGTVSEVATLRMVTQTLLLIVPGVQYTGWGGACGRRGYGRSEKNKTSAQATA